MLSLELENAMANIALAEDLRRLAQAFTENSDEMKKAELEVANFLVEAVRPMTPILTGSLASSHAVFVTKDQTFVSINPEAQNPFSDEDPWQYGPELHRMGGLSKSKHRRDFYTHLVLMHGQYALDMLEESFILTLDVFG